MTTGNGFHTLRVYARDEAENWAKVTYLFTTDDETQTSPTTLSTNPEENLDALFSALGIVGAVSVPVIVFLYAKSYNLRHRKMINLYMKKELSIEDIAKKTGKTKPQVEEVLRKAKKIG